MIDLATALEADPIVHATRSGVQNAFAPDFHSWRRCAMSWGPLRFALALQHLEV
jgi:hypothetical protein